MYSGISDSTHYLTRTGSHATKGSRNGSVDRPAYLETEALYGGLKDELQIALSCLMQLHTEAQEINDHLAGRLDADRKRLLERRRCDLGELTQEQQKKVGDLKTKARALAHQSFSECFMEQARSVLSHEMFMAVVEETRNTLGRPHQELKPRHSEFISDGSRPILNRKEKLRMKRRRLRRRLASDTPET